jgi:hypothetical protein
LACYIGISFILGYYFHVNFLESWDWPAFILVVLILGVGITGGIEIQKNDEKS